jgi:hypothetical protein
MNSPQMETGPMAMDWTTDDTPIQFSMGERYGRKADVTTPIISGVLLLLGIPLLLAGAGVGRSLTRELDDGGLAGLGVVGLILSAIGGWSLVNSIIYRIWRATRGTGAEWQRDYPWDPRGCSDLSRSEFRQYLGCGLVALLFAAMAIGFALSCVAGVIAFAIVAGLFLLLSVFQLGCSLWVWKSNLRHGTSRLVYARCPYELGSRFEGRWLGGELLRQAERVELEIRCVEERGTYGSDGTSDGVERWQLILLKRTVVVDEPLRRSGCLSLLVDLPQDVRLKTNLSAKTSNADVTAVVVNRIFHNVQAIPRYWTLTVRNPDRIGGFRAEFLIPVY